MKDNVNDQQPPGRIVQICNGIGQFVALGFYTFGAIIALVVIGRELLRLF